MGQAEMLYNTTEREIPNGDVGISTIICSYYEPLIVEQKGSMTYVEATME